MLAMVRMIAQERSINVTIHADDDDYVGGAGGRGSQAQYRSRFLVNAGRNEKLTHHHTALPVIKAGAMTKNEEMKARELRMNIKKRKTTGRQRWGSEGCWFG